MFKTETGLIYNIYNRGGRQRSIDPRSRSQKHFELFFLQTIAIHGAATAYFILVPLRKNVEGMYELVGIRLLFPEVPEVTASISVGIKVIAVRRSSSRIRATYGS